MRCRPFLTAIAAAALAMPAVVEARQIFPPGTFLIDGTPVTCGRVDIVLDPALPDVGYAGPGVIVLNPRLFDRLPTTLKFFWAVHECAHHMVGLDEAKADCWAIRVGRRQGWFPPEAFRLLENALRNNRGDSKHLPGPQRVRAMKACYDRR